MQQKILVITDNHYLFRKFKLILDHLSINSDAFDFCCTSKSTELLAENLKKIDIKKGVAHLVSTYDLIFSLHCKQIFPKELVQAVKCINIHPGFNPCNRGWYPQVFSIINKLTAGATIHEMDEQIDHGKIIVQKPVAINAWDTSIDVYNKILSAELELLQESLIDILNNNYHSFAPVSDGNYNGINDYKNLLEIKLDEVVKTGDLIDRLRALTHGQFKNAFFIDPVTGNKIFIRIQLDKE